MARASEALVCALQCAPPMNRRRRRFGDALRAALLFIAVAGGIPAAQGFRQDEVECEEATLRLDECCPGFDPKKVDCTFVPGCDNATYPSLTSTESECILAKGCDDLRARHVCERLLSRQTGAPADASTSSAGEVCP